MRTLKPSHTQPNLWASLTTTTMKSSTLTATIKKSLIYQLLYRKSQRKPLTINKTSWEFSTTKQLTHSIPQDLQSLVEILMENLISLSLVRSWKTSSRSLRALIWLVNLWHRLMIPQTGRQFQINARTATVPTQECTSQQLLSPSNHRLLLSFKRYPNSLWKLSKR